jgi:hypothetical protein
LGSGPAGNFTSGAELNKQEDLYNRYNINSAYGSRSFTTDPTTGRSVLNINETPTQKAIRELQEGQAINTLSSKAYGPEDFAAQGKQINDALFNSSYLNLKPQFQEEDTGIRDYLSNRGIPLSSNAYSKAISNLYRDRSNQLNQLSLQSVLAGAQEQDRLTRLAEAQRAARLAETGNATQGIDLGFFGNVANINAAQNIAGQEGASNAYNLSRYQDAQKRRSAATNELIKGAFSSAGGKGKDSSGGGAEGASSALAASDINLKENIRFIGNSSSGIPIYHFDYKNKNFGVGRYEGVMAQDLEKIKPQAVLIASDGYKMVDYSIIDVQFKRVN